MWYSNRTASPFDVAVGEWSLSKNLIHCCKVSVRQRRSALIENTHIHALFNIFLFYSCSLQTLSNTSLQLSHTKRNIYCLTTLKISRSNLFQLYLLWIIKNNCKHYLVISTLNFGTNKIYHFNAPFIHHEYYTSIKLWKLLLWAG